MEHWSEGVVLRDVPQGAAGQLDRVTLERMGHPMRVCHGPGSYSARTLSDVGPWLHQPCVAHRTR
mgnify:CR=1 FL=1